MKSTIVATLFLLFSFHANSQTADERVRFTCQEVQHLLPDAVQSNAIVLEQTDGNALDFMKPMMNAEAGFELNYFRGKSGEKKLAEILKSTADVYRGKADNMGSDSLFFDGNKLNANGNLGIEAKTFVIFFTHENRGQYSTPKTAGFVQFKCGEPEYFKIKETPSTDISGEGSPTITEE